MIGGVIIGHEDRWIVLKQSSASENLMLFYPRLLVNSEETLSNHRTEVSLTQERNSLIVEVAIVVEGSVYFTWKLLVGAKCKLSRRAFDG